MLICAIKILLPNFCSYCVLTDAGADVSRRRLPAQVLSVVLSFLPVTFDASRANRRVVLYPPNYPTFVDDVGKI